jgi:ribosomal protein S18 acetylase RimI-like enzyme
MTEVRELTGEDWLAWRVVRLRSLRDSPSAFGSTYARELGFTELTWRRRLDDPDAVSVLAQEGGSPVGIAAGFQDAPGRLHVVAMWVAPEARGRRVCHLLLDALRSWAEARGLRLHLDVESGNVAARRSYEAYGFVATGASHPLREGSPETTDRLLLPAGRDASART